MQAAIAGLEARLARGGGSDADWELLAKAYEFLGRNDDAQRARSHIVSASPDLATLMAEAEAAGGALRPGASASQAAARTDAPSSPATSLEDLRRRVQSHPDDAQSWADYADALASGAGGSLTGPAGSAIDRALALDPANPKALWLKASQAHEQHRFGEALSWWHRLRAVLPADSPDLRIIDANIAEDNQLGGARAAGAAAASGRAAGTAAAAAEVSGTVSIDSRLASRVRPDATLFVYAKAADSPGPPLAVLRTSVTGWPMSFRLDDSMAMLPSRRLSQFDKVVIEARLSRSGQATPGSGDLYVTSAAVSPGAGPRLALVIDREIN
jgi:cytochrome c-type biogenesis protein CcmH